MLLDAGPVLLDILVQVIITHHMLALEVKDVQQQLQHALKEVISIMERVLVVIMPFIVVVERLHL